MAAHFLCRFVAAPMQRLAFPLGKTKICITSVLNSSFLTPDHKSLAAAPSVPLKFPKIPVKIISKKFI